MTPFLLDLNLLIALAWPSHVHHGIAHQWFSMNSPAGWATCPLTQCGFLRISSNPTIIDDAASPLEALDVLERLMGHKNHQFWPDDVSFSRPSTIPCDLLVGHRQITDAYLLGLAIKNKGKLATLDRKIAALLADPVQKESHLEIVS